MIYRGFGQLAWPVSEVGYGMWGMGGWTGSEDSESLAAMQLAVEQGCNFFDTAWVYGGGHSETLLGQLLKANPGKRLYTATKIPPKNKQWPSRREHTLADCYPPEHIDKYIELSLTNAGVSSFDLVQFHTWEDSWLEDKGLGKKMDEIRSQGLVGAWGISSNRWESWNGVKAVKSGLIGAVQYIYNIFDQSSEDELLPACRANGVAFIARVPFDEGSLTGNLTKDSKWPEGDWRNTYFVPENLNATIDRVEKLRPLVPEGWSMAEMALRFILDNPDVSTVIPGMRKLQNVRSSLGVSGKPPLATSLMAELKKHRWDRLPTKWSQ